MDHKETQEENELLHAQTKLMGQKLQDAREEILHSNNHTMRVSDDLDFVLTFADKMADELPENSIARRQYERIKNLLNIA